MARGGNMLGVGGARQHLGRKALRGGGPAGRIGGGTDPQAQKRALLRKLQEQRDAEKEPKSERKSEQG